MNQKQIISDIKTTQKARWTTLGTGETLGDIVERAMHKDIEDLLDLVNQTEEAVFDWTAFEEYQKTVSKVNDKLIFQHFKQYGRGNPDSFEDLSQREMDWRREFFREAWLLCQMYLDK